MKIKFFRSYQSTVPIFITDQESDILCRLAVNRKSVTEAIFLPLDYDWYEFIENKKSFVLLDLLSVLEKKNTQDLPELYKEVKKLYKTEIIVFFKMYIYKFIKDSKDKHDIETLKNIYLFDFYPNIEKEDKKEIGLWWDEHQHNLLNIYKKIENDMAREIERNETSTNLGAEFETVEPFPISDQKNLGYILEFEVATEDTTGSCFDRFITNQEFPLAKYKTFHKKYNKNQVKNCFNTVTKCDTKNRCPHCDSEFECQPVDTGGFVQGQHLKQGKYCFQKSEEDFRYFNDLRIYNKEYEVNIHCKTTARGLWIQSIIILESDLDSIEKIMIMLGLDGKVTRQKKFGQKMQFTIKNTYIDSSVFSDMVMNEQAFSVFFSVNDTDKISKQNRSVYLYFDDFQTKKTLKSTDILVGGWKRSFSRHGDLTAIVQSEKDNENVLQVCIRVIRSINENIIQSFIDKISKFLKLYNLKYEQYIKLYKQLLSDFVPYKPEVSDKKEDDKALQKLLKAEPKIFISNIYGRSCQNPKPIIVEDPVLLENTPNEKKLMFPPIPFDDMKPRFYMCPTEPYKGEKYLYPGLKQIKLADHPFGYFPCCYKEKNWYEKNLKISKMIEDKIKGTTITKLSPTKNIDHIIKTNKIIDNLGQLGILPQGLEKFMLFINPLNEYFRMGIPTQHNFLLCLEYQHSKKNNIPMRQVNDILNLIIKKNNINIGLQENYDIEREGIIQLLEQGIVLPERFIRILENFYDVTIYLFHKDRSGTLSLKPPNHYRSYYRYKNMSRPIVAIYQHWGGTMDDLIKIENAHCELIVARAFNNKFSYQFMHDKTGWQSISYLGLQFYDGKHLDVDLSIKEGYLFDNLTSQYVDSIGKLRILFFRGTFPGFLLQPCAPLTLPLETESTLPGHKELESFLSKAGDIIVFSYRGFTFYKVKMGSIQIFFPTRGKHLAVKPAVHLHGFLDSILQFFNEDSRISHIQYKIRISSVIQDYVLYFLANFIDKELLGHPIEDWIQLFFDKHFFIVPDKHIYPDFSSIPVVFKDNVKGLIKDNRLFVASRVRDKLVYFIKWFMTRRGEPELVKIKKLREIPSYYQYTEDFTRHDDQVIYNYDFFYKKTINYAYINTELSLIDHPLNEPFYYYNPSQLGIHPYLLVQVVDKDRAASVVRAWKKEGVIRLDEKMSDKEIVVDLPVGKDVTGNLVWSELPGSVGRVAPAKGSTFLAILQL